MRRDLTGKSIIITGASSGIGAATAIRCAAVGMDIVLHGRDAERLAHVASRVRDAGRRAVTIVGDVTEPDLNDRLLGAAEGELGGVYAVFANAGYGFKKPAHEVTDDELRRIFDVNFFAANALLGAAARRLIAAGRPGHLLMCSSAIALFTTQRFSAYSATKAAQHHVCRAMRMELAPHGIEVTSVHPITTRTDFFDRAAVYAGRPSDPDGAFDGVPRWLLQRPEQVADAIVRCLRRPRPEVWTALGPRILAAAMHVFPRLMDTIGRRVP
jgi:short-subunit dehydrogenase